MNRIHVSLPLCFLLASLGACEDDPAGVQPDPGIARREAGWLRGDFHVHTDVEGGFDDLATTIALVDYLQSDLFLARHPDYRGADVDFLTITEHNTVASQSDPVFVNDRLLLVGGEELGGAGHANCIGITERVEYDGGGGPVDATLVAETIDEVHARGGLYSINHPFLPTIAWTWDVRTMDAVEVWNSGYGLADPTFKPEDLVTWEAERGTLSPLFRRAVELDQGRGSASQALTYYRALLSRGVHVAVLGGSDRHAVVLPGFPSTWIHAPTPDRDGIVEGIRRRHTFISRTPVSTQVLVEVTHEGTTYAMGDQIPVPDAGVELTVTVRVGRGDGGKLRLYSGDAVASDAELATSTLGGVIFEQDVAGPDFTVQTSLTARPGTWFFPVVLDPLVRPDLTADRAAQVRDLAAKVAATGEEDYNQLINIVMPLLDETVLFEAELCDPAHWPDHPVECLPPDDGGIATYFVPDWLDRALNVTIENDAITDWAMGAIGSALLCTER